MDFRSNEDWYCRRWGREFYGPSQGAVYDVVFTEESTAPQLLIPNDEVKNFCKIDVSEDDALLEEIQFAAILKCEAMLNIGFYERVTTAIIDNRNGGFFLPYGPIGTITTIKGIAPTTEQVKGSTWKQVLWPYEDHLEVVYVGGYATLPYSIKLGLLQCIFFMYDERVRRENPYPPIYQETLKPFSRNV